MDAPGVRARAAPPGEGAPRVKQELAEEDSELLQPHDVGFKQKHHLARYGSVEHSAQPKAAKEAAILAGFRVASVKEDPVDMEEAGDKQEAIDEATSIMEFKTVLVKDEPMDMEDVAQREALDSEEQAETQNVVGTKHTVGTQDGVTKKWETVFVKQEPVDEDDTSMPAAPGESQTDAVFTNNSVRSNVVEVGKKRVYPTASQKSRLIALVQADEGLRRGKFSSSFTKRDGERRWANIAREVNSIPGTKREWKEWRKTWQDMKAAAKKKSAAFRFSVTSTEGPPTTPRAGENVAAPISMSSSAVFGHTDCNESIVHFQDVPSTSSKPSMSDETRTGQENRSKGTKVLKRRAAARRLDPSLATSQSMKKLMEEKFAIKKIFYESVIAEMKAQTAILQDICDKL